MKLKNPQCSKEEKRVAIEILRECEGEVETWPGDAGGNLYRWQDYLHVARAAIKAYRMMEKMRDKK